MEFDSRRALSMHIIRAHNEQKGWDNDPIQEAVDKLMMKAQSLSQKLAEYKNVQEEYDKINKQLEALAEAQQKIHAAEGLLQREDKENKQDA